MLLAWARNFPRHCCSAGCTRQSTAELLPRHGVTQLNPPRPATRVDRFSARADRAYLIVRTGGGAPTPADSEGLSHLGCADAALALDEEVAGPIRILPRAAVQVLQGAYPGTTIRRVRASKGP